MRIRTTVLAATMVALVTLSGCEADSTGGGDPPKAKSDAPNVPWKDYAPTLKAQIDRLGKAKKCGKLQQAFDTADANGDTTMTRTGHNNADLMDYIDFRMKQANCY